MTITAALQEIHKIYQGDTSYPDVGTSDYLVRLSYANNAINMWENDKGIYWNELFASQYSTVPNGAVFNAPPQLKFPANYLYLYDSNNNATLFSYLKTWQARFDSTANPGDQTYFLTGSGSSKYINLNPTPTTANGLVGKTAKIDFYKFANTYSTGLETNEIEMSDPYFLVEWVLYMLFTNDQDSNRSSLHFQLANEKLKAMRISNEVNPYYQNNQFIDLMGGFGV